jgi:two-component system LytT family response regulator
MLKVAILDDERNSVEVLQLLIEKYCPGLEITAMFTDPAEAVVALRATPPDVLFLDIEMPGLSGFEVLDQLRPAPFSVVFTTAYNQYAVRAFKYSAVDYLLKPISRQEVLHTAARLQETRQLLHSSQYDLLRQAYPATSAPERIALTTSEGLQIVAVADIMYCESEGPYTHVHFWPKGRLLVSRTLKEADEVLTPCGFMRVHHSFLVNLRYVERYIRGEGGEMVMKNGAHVPLARSKKQVFLEGFARI